MNCPVCGNDEMFVRDSGEYKGVEWLAWICDECGHEESDEPDWDSEPGGHDDY
jgi:rubrerythrin